MKTLLLLLVLLPSAVCAEWSPVYTPLKGHRQTYDPKTEQFSSTEQTFSTRWEFTIPDTGNAAQIISVPTAYLDMVKTEIYNGVIWHRDENLIVINMLLFAEPKPSKQMIFTLYPRERAGFVTMLQAPYASNIVSSYSVDTIPLVKISD